ncbi:hypothetical protein BGZ51_005137 [Haplosporangium sp. Z 767]|nr:hypothetical protein BGZ51_005137 [Haplosporangium sp. Z 767]
MPSSTPFINSGEVNIPQQRIVNNLQMATSLQQELDNHSHNDKKSGYPMSTPHSPITHKIAQRGPLPPIDTILGHTSHTSRIGRHLSLDGSSSASGSVPSSPPPPYPPSATSLEELSAASLQYFSAHTNSPAKLDHLQNLMSSLQTIMNTQSFAMDALRVQLDEIQGVLDRVNPKADIMTMEERQVLQNAQKMKNLAEEVIITKLASESRTAIIQKAAHGQDIQSETPLLTISMTSFDDRDFEPTEAPPPTASTPPPINVFQMGSLRHSSSNASLASSSTDRQYTRDDEERTSRPSSVSSFHRQQKKRSRQSMRQLEPMSSASAKDSSRRDEESNASFDRICSLLTHLITDASTAVSTAPNGSQLSPNIPVPQLSPLIQSDSESSADSTSDHDDDDDNIDSISPGTNRRNLFRQDMEQEQEQEQEIDFLKRLQGPEGAPNKEELELEVEVEPTNRYRTGLRSRHNKPTKRLSSLFAELQNTQIIQDDISQGSPHTNDASSERKSLESPERTKTRHRHSLSLRSTPSSHSLRPRSVSMITGTSTDGLDPTGIVLELPDPDRTSGSRTSIASDRSYALQEPHKDEQWQVTQNVDSELDRTVETIDGLTRELVAVATHQNWMQTKLQKTLEFQRQQVEQIERVHSTPHSQTNPLLNRQQYPATFDHPPQQQRSLYDSPSGQHPLMDLSRSLKQVAVSVGRVLASSASTASHHNSGPGNKRVLDSMGVAPQGHTSQTGRLSRKDFSQYFQELEKIAALGGKIGFGKDEEDLKSADHTGESQDQLNKHRFSGSSFNTIENGCSLSSAASTIVLDEDLAQPSAELKCTKDMSENPEHVRGQVSTLHSSRGSTSSPPPELEDFAAQCRLLTRALVLPFVQLTHHAMTSQDSALALSPRSSKFSDPARDLNSTLEIVQGLEQDQEKPRKTLVIDDTHLTSTRGTSSSDIPVLDSHHQKESSGNSSLPNWNTPLSLTGQDLDTILKGHGDLSPDAIVKVKAFISTGLYLIHLLYWTVLFVIGTIVLDPWLAETAGQQVVKVMDQVRESMAKDNHPGRTIGATYEDNSHRQLSSGRSHRNTDLSDDIYQGHSFPCDGDQREGPEFTLEQTRLQALEDRAIQVAVGFESLKYRLGSSPSPSRPNSRPASGLWSTQGSFQVTSTQRFSPEEPATMTAIQEKSASQAKVRAGEAGLMRTMSWVGPRRRRHAKDGNLSKTRRLSNTRTMNTTFPLPKMDSVLSLPGGMNIKRDRPLSHWGSFGSTLSTASPVVRMGSQRDYGSVQQVQTSPAAWVPLVKADEDVLRQTMSRRKSL